MSATIKPGLIILHSNQLEQLSSAVFEWIGRNPLSPLEKEIFLVQSNGVAEWLKIALAEHFDICAASRIELPGRFLWTIYRTMLGREQIPQTASLDKVPLTWRLMRLIPELLALPDFAGLKQFLAMGDAERRYQLVSRIADLMDLYQVYRTDWLHDWSLGLDQLRRANGETQPLTEDQRWQSALWRAILQDLPPEQRLLGRVNVHQRFIEAALRHDAPHGTLPRRVVLFGISALSRQTLEALSALSGYTQVILGIPNPCQYFWGDIIDGRELFKSQMKRQAYRNQQDLSLIPLEDLHAHAHPLLASWGRMGRDFIRMLDDFDHAGETRAGFPQLKIDLFSEGSGHTLLEQVQAAVRDLLPMAEHPRAGVAEDDRSIEFHIAHSAQREIEILHDRLLSVFGSQNTPAIRPRDVIVMVPDIAQFTPSIRAVFDQYKHSDARYIPYEIGDLSERKTQPLMVALEWLLRLPQQRCQQTEIMDLLEVPALAGRFGLEAEDVVLLKRWIAGAGIRWGLNLAHRAELGLGAAGEQNSWMFGLRRMLLGYASGAAMPYQGIEPYAEIAGLDSAQAGCLAELVTALIDWQRRLAQSWRPEEWATQARQLLQTFFTATGEADRALLVRLEDALEDWLHACEQSGFDEPLPLAVFREPWLSGMDESTLTHRFISGGVTFCTFMPMRSMPFQMVCLLGMNEGDFPRRASQMDFDLLALPGMARPGDRSRRDDDRYLMLEAILSARQKLYISWVGKHIRDNSEQPPSVLVSQFREYLATGWAMNLSGHTTEYPMQAFSRQYFVESETRPLTYARKWGAAYQPASSEMQVSELQDCSDLTVDIDPEFILKADELGRFLKQPVAYFFQKRLGVIFDQHVQETESDEPLCLDALQEYFLNERMIDNSMLPSEPAELEAHLQQKAMQLKREGILPVGWAGQAWQRKLVQDALPVQLAWISLMQQFPDPAEKRAADFFWQGIHLSDWLHNLRTDQQQVVFLKQIAGKICLKDGSLRIEKLIDIWLSLLLGAAADTPPGAYLVASDAVLYMAPVPAEQAASVLQQLITYWKRGMNEVLPVACKTALAYIAEANPRDVYDGSIQMRGEVNNPYLARIWPDYAAISNCADWDQVSRALYEPLFLWAKEIVVAPIDADQAGQGAA